MTQAISAGVRFFQYRDKVGTRRAIYDTALSLAQTAHRAGALFIVNDHTDIAAAVAADGVHLGQDDLPIAQARKLLGKDRIIGISTHSREQAEAAERSGADYIGFGPIYATSTKDAGAVQGIDNLKIIRQAVGIPVIAIGGINHANVGDVIRAGAGGAAVISAVLGADDVASAIEEMVRSIAGKTLDSPVSSTGQS